MISCAAVISIVLAIVCLALLVILLVLIFTHQTPDTTKKPRVVVYARTTPQTRPKKLEGNSVRRVRFLGESRRNASKRRKASNDFDHLIAPTARHIAQPQKFTFGVFDENMNSLITGKDIIDITEFNGKAVYLTKNMGKLLFQETVGLRDVFVKPHAERIVGFGSKLLGICDGVMHEFTETSRSTGEWTEVTIPTRQILHCSASGDGKILVVRDLDYAYTLDQSLNVLSDGPSTENRCYGANASIYSDEAENTNATFDSQGNLVKVDDAMRSRGVKSVHFVAGKIMYITKN